MIRITVYGDARPAGSKRAVPFGKSGRYGVIDANPKAADWKKEVAQAAGKIMDGKMLLRGPLAVRMTFYRARPKAHYGTGRNAGKLKDSAPPFPTSAPDCLKTARGVEDALTRVVYIDDAQIVTEVLAKRWGEPARCEIEVRELTAVDVKLEADGEMLELWGAA